jgi:hypothetical protein
VTSACKLLPASTRYAILREGDAPSSESLRAREWKVRNLGRFFTFK